MREVFSQKLLSKRTFQETRVETRQLDDNQSIVQDYSLNTTPIKALDSAAEFQLSELEIRALKSPTPAHIEELIP